MGKHTVASWTLRLAGCAILWLTASAAQAAPDNGFGLYVGPIHSNDSGLYGTSRGVSVGADAQFMVNDDWSLNPYLNMTSESTDQTFHLVNGTAGLQARRWFGGSWFLGAEYLFHDLLLRNNGTVESSIYGPGLGVAAGWESASHWSVMVEWDGLEGQGFSWSSGNNRNDVRVVVGYHWY